jgi:DivIVA domain-containing protein
MNDEIFRLTPVDVRRMEFPKAMRGYDQGRVDDFRVQVADELERLTRVNQDLDSSVRSLTEQLRKEQILVTRAEDAPERALAVDA